MDDELRATRHDTAANSKAGADQARTDPNQKAKALEAEKATPKTDDVDAVAPLSGGDRGGLGAKGWSEVPEDRIGGHPELETAPSSDAGGGLNGPQPETDLKTGAPIPPPSAKP